jgi:acyl-CoA thioester hydrolase
VEGFNHSLTQIVEFHEVDMLGVCNNAVYFNYFENARIKYVKDLKKKYNLKELLEGNSFFIMVHNNCDYLQSAHLDDELIIFTKIDFVKNTSFGFKHLVYKKEIDKIIAKGGGVVVHIDKSTQTPIPLPQEFYDAVQDFESDVMIQKK